MYWYGNIGFSVPDPSKTSTQITTSFKYGTSIVSVTSGTETYKIIVIVKNYQRNILKKKLLNIFIKILQLKLTN